MLSKKLAKAVLIATLPAFLLAGCAGTGITAPTGSQATNAGIGAFQYTVAATSLLSTYLQVEPMLIQAQNQIQANLSNFTPTQQVQLQQIGTNLTSLQQRVLNMLTGTGTTGTILLSFGELQLIYAEAQGDYLNAKAIIAPNLSKLPAGTQSELKALDALATQLNNEMTTVNTANVNGVNVTALLEGALTMAGTGASIAAGLSGLKASLPLPLSTAPTASK